MDVTSNKKFTLEIPNALAKALNSLLVGLALPVQTRGEFEIRECERLVQATYYR